MASPIALRVNGVEVVDFKRASVSYSLESFARSFSFDFSDKWLQTLNTALPFAEGDPCEIYVHGVKVIDGMIDDVPISYDANSHSLSVVGRSWNGHMVDCSAEHKGGSWRNVTLGRLAKDLAEPFGVGVIIDPWAQDLSVTPPLIDRWAIEDEETAHGCLQRAVEMRGLFLTSDAGRNIVITKASRLLHPASLVFGQNIKSASRTGRFAERYSHYLVKSQRAGSDTHFGDLVASQFARVEDPGVTAYRPLIIVADGPGKPPQLETRATWERNLRAGRSRRITYEVHGHGTEFGAIWPINKLVSVTDPYLDANAPLLIAGVTLTYDEGGEIATLELGRPEAFDVLGPPPSKPKPKKSAAGGEGFVSWLNGKVFGLLEW